MFIKNTPCPNCNSSRGVAIYKNEDHIAHHCFRCHKHWVFKEGTLEESTIEIRGSIDLNELHSVDIPERFLTKEACEYYGVKVEVDEINGEISHHYYPYVNKDGDRVYKVRKLPKEFYFIGSAKGLQFFGQDLVGTGGKLLVICEGELDTLAVYQTLKKHGKNYRVVGIPNGASDISSVKNNLEWLESFETIIFCFDQDIAGEEGFQKIADLLTPGKSKIMKFSEKDPCKMLQVGKESELYKAVFSAKTFHPAGIISGQDTWDLIKEKQKVDCVMYPDDWKDFNHKTYGIRLGELDTWTSGSGCVDCDTEFLTPYGWKKISEYNNLDLVGQIDINSNRLIFNYPLNYIKAPCTTLIQFETKYGINQCLSDEHVVLYKNNHNVYKTSSFHEIKNRHIQSIYGFHGKFPTTTRLFREDSDEFTTWELLLQVAVQADGRIVKNGKDNYTQMRFTKIRKYNRLLEICKLGKLKYKDNGVNNEGYYEVIVWPKYPDKIFDEKYWNLGHHQLLLMAKESLFWDGDQKRNYSTNIKANADFIQYAWTVNNIRATIYEDKRHHNINYIVHKCGNNFVSISNSNKKIELKSYQTKDGYKYCFTTHTGFLILRRNNCIFITGNSGKTQFIRELQYHIFNQTKENIGVIALEEPITDSIEALMSLHLNKRIHLPDVRASVSDDDLYSAWLATAGTNRFHFYDHFGSVDEESLLSKIRYLARALDCKYIFLDHLSIVVSEFASDGDERCRIDTVMTKLKKLTQELMIWIGLIVHLRKTSGGRSFEEGGVPTLDDLRGSGSIKQLSNSVYATSRNQQASDIFDRNTNHLHVLKCRFTGRTGPSDKIYFDEDTGRMCNLELVKPKEEDMSL